MLRISAPCCQPGGSSVQEEFMVSHCRKIRNTLEDLTERLTGSVSGTLSHFLVARSVFSTTRQPGSALAGSFSVWAVGSSRASPPSTALTQGHQSRCCELGSKKLLKDVSELLEEQSRARLALRRGLDGTSVLSLCTMLRVTGRLLSMGLVTSNSARSMGTGESQPREREMAGDGLFSCCSEPGGSASWLRVSILRGEAGRRGQRSVGAGEVLLGLQESSSGPADSSW